MPSSDSATDRFTVRLKAGDYAFREGDAGAALFVIEEGRVELTSSAAPQHIEVLEVGDFFGTASLFANDRVREISARATAPSRLLRIDRTAFNEIVRAQPEIALVMLRRVTERAAREETLAAPELEVGHLTHVLSGTRFTLDGDELGIGRRSANIVPDVDLTELDPDKTLSRRHARIFRTASGYALKEEEGRNGTFVNGDRLAAGQEVKLEEGDRVRFGLVELVFRTR